MSTDPKPPKPMPSAAEINAYLERSAARSKLHLPLAKGAAAVMDPPTQPAQAAPSGNASARALPLKGAKKLPTQQREAAADEAPAPRPAQGDAAKPEPGPEAEGSAWRPYSSDDEH